MIAPLQESTSECVRATASRRARVLFCGGGTGGHLMPAITLANAAHARWPGLQTRFLVAGREAEAPFFSDRRDQVVALFRGDSGRPAPWRLDRYLCAYATARAEVASFAPDVVVLLGGYVALAGLAAAPELPLLLLESNVCPGKTARLLASRADAILLEWPQAAHALGVSTCVASGMPQPCELFDRDARADRVALGLDPEVPVLLWFGGSQGALGLNRLAREVLPRLAAALPALQVIIGSGARVEGVSDLVLPRPVTLRVERFLWPMARYYGAADVVVGRAGGMTVAEVCAAGRASILVPYPHHRDQHQKRNALRLVNEDAAVMIEERPQAAADLERALIDLLSTADLRTPMAVCARSLAKPGAADAALDLLEQLILRVPRSAAGLQPGREPRREPGRERCMLRSEPAAT